LRGEVSREPGQKRAGHGARRTPLDKTQEPVADRGQVQTVAGDRLPLGVIGWSVLLHQA